MSNFDSRDGDRALRNSLTRCIQGRDQDFAEFRSHYERLMKDERQQLRDWIEKVADLQDAPVYLFIKASVQLMDGNSEDSVNITLFPRKLLSAMDAWDHDEIFEDSLVDCMG